MAALLSGEGFRFLFRTDKGVVSREVWWLGTALTGAVAFVTTMIWFAIAPMATSDLSRRGLIDPTAIGVYAYLIAYAFVVMLCGICWYNLSAKRFRDLGLAPSLAGLPLVLALFAGAAHWTSPRLPDMVPFWSPWLLDAALAVVIAWTIYQLGFQSSAREG